MSKAYYNEIDPQAAEWLRELIKAGLIADGIVDERSIEDIKPEELNGYTQCHFFAGLGVWSYALKQAGWSDDRQVWTGSCPCQPFSNPGKRKGFADERHLWPAFHWLIKQCRPLVVFGEQVAGKAGEAWLDVVSTDLEGEDYAIGSVVAAACGFGAPHQRKRLYWVAKSDGYEHQREVGGIDGAEATEAVSDGKNLVIPRESGGAGDDVLRVANTDEKRLQREWSDSDSEGRERQNKRQIGLCDRAGAAAQTHPTNGFWRESDWIKCHDENWRPVEPGASPLAHVTTEGVGRMQPRLEGMGKSPSEIRRIMRRPKSLLAMASRNRVARLKGYGNAIVAEQARIFIESYLEINK